MYMFCNQSAVPESRVIYLIINRVLLTMIQSAVTIFDLSLLHCSRICQQYYIMM